MSNSDPTKHKGEPMCSRGVSISFFLLDTLQIRDTPLFSARIFASQPQLFRMRSTIRVITKLPNSEQSYKGKVKTRKYINRQNQSTTGKL